MDDHRIEHLLTKLQELTYIVNDGDLQQLMSAINKTNGNIISKILAHPVRTAKVHTAITDKLVQLDKPFCSGLFTLIKQSSKWENQENVILIVGLIPKIITVHAILYFRERPDDRVQLIEVVMFTFYSEYMERVNLLRQEKEHSSNILGCFPELNALFEPEFKDSKRQKQFNKITQINATNILDTYELMMEFYYSKMLQLSDKFNESFVEMGLILCGAIVPLEQLPLRQINNLQYSLFNVQISDKCLEVIFEDKFQILLLGAYNLQALKKNIPWSQTLINQLLIKCANEARYYVKHSYVYISRRVWLFRHRSQLRICMRVYFDNVNDFMKVSPIPLNGRYETVSKSVFCSFFDASISYEMYFLKKLITFFPHQQQYDQIILLINNN